MRNADQVTELPAETIVRIDESGRHGPNLIIGGHFVLGSTILDDREAQLVLDELGPLPHGAREWKFSYLRRSVPRARSLLDALTPDSVLATAVHHRFFAWSKLLDTLLYELAAHLGTAPLSDARQAQVIWLVQRSWEDVRKDVDGVIGAFVEAWRRPSEQALYELGRQLRRLSSTVGSASTRRDVLRPLVRAHRDMTLHLMRDLAPQEPGGGTDGVRLVDHLDPHTPALGALVMGWRARLGLSARISLVHDEIFPKDIVERWETHLAVLHGVSLRRGTSVGSPALQLADLVAGAASTALAPTAGDAIEEGVAALFRSVVTSWLPADLTIWPWSDPRSALRPEGGVALRIDPDP